MRQSVVFFHSCSDKNINNNPREHAGDFCGEAGQPALFTWGPYDAFSAVSRGRGCGSFEAHWGGSTSSNLAVFKLWPTCMSITYDSQVLYVTSVSWPGGWSTRERVRGTGTGTAHTWMSQQTTREINLWLSCCSQVKTNLLCFSIWQKNNHADWFGVKVKALSWRQGRVLTSGQGLLGILLFIVWKTCISDVPYLAFFLIRRKKWNNYLVSTELTEHWLR